ncbi:GNAT family N-acetyltransferase [Amphibacillus sediminis]|uniref:GNAT family N-acetyltransferase n=1 Tax=Amphibacillus sediminis TaxID=360185 RepID=UPI000833D43E|nr:GNAT family protein [Amphibacillus sediminis]
MVILEFFTEVDFQTLIDWNNDLSERFLFQWAGHEFEYPLTKEQLEKYLDGANRPDGNRFIYRVIDSNSRRVIGHLQISGRDQDHGSAQITRVLVGEQSDRGKGYGRQIIHAACQLIFDQWGMHRASLRVFDFNRAAISCYEKAGFQMEALFREARKMNGQYFDLCEMSLLDHEWCALKY